MRRLNIENQIPLSISKLTTNYAPPAGYLEALADVP
jgi:hypothetical protein